MSRLLCADIFQKPQGTARARYIKFHVLHWQSEIARVKDLPSSMFVRLSACSPPGLSLLSNATCGKGYNRPAQPPGAGPSRATESCPCVQICHFPVLGCLPVNFPASQVHSRQTPSSDHNCFFSRIGRFQGKPLTRGTPRAGIFLLDFPSMNLAYHYHRLHLNHIILQTNRL
jgi:hypothetical protein